jgi:glycine hydroxymethyltransferase
MLKPGDTILGMQLSHGGHLSHGHPANISGKYFKVVSYGVEQKTGLIDYKQVREIAKSSNPKIIVAGCSSYSRAIDWKEFRKICDETGALLMADIAHYAGLIAVGAYPSPVKYADFVTTTTHKTLRGPRGGIVMCKKEYAAAIDKAVFPGIQGGPLMHVIAAKAVALGEALKPEFKKYQYRILKNSRALAAALKKKGYDIVSGGTDCHMFLVDLTARKLTGLEVEKALDIAGITLNKNTIPFDPLKPFISSGIRIGTPTVTTRGMNEKEMGAIASLIDEAIAGRADEKVLAAIRGKVKKLCVKFPI